MVKNNLIVLLLKIEWNSGNIEKEGHCIAIKERMKNLRTNLNNVKKEVCHTVSKERIKKTAYKLKQCWKRNTSHCCWRNANRVWEIKPAKGFHLQAKQ